MQGLHKSVKMDHWHYTILVPPTNTWVITINFEFLHFTFPFLPNSSIISAGLPLPNEK